MAVIDVVTFNGEYDLFEIRYNILKDYVDEFIVVEAPTTFSGREKSLYFKHILDKYEKVKYFVIDENYTEEEKSLADNSPNTRGATHWRHEFLQKESIKKALTHLKDDDLVFIGDCDEIWEPIMATDNNGKPVKLKLLVYTYYLNNRSSEPFWGTLKARYGDIKNECLNHLRTNHERRMTINECGWHFTSLKDGLKRKLEDSYTKESYATDEVMSNLEENIENNRDFLGRNFKYWIDEDGWPEYLKENREKYLHLLK